MWAESEGEDDEYLEGSVADEECRLECVDLARAPGQGGHVGGHSGTCADFHGLVAAPLPVLVYEPVNVLALLECGVHEVIVVGMEDEVNEIFPTEVWQWGATAFLWQSGEVDVSELIFKGPLRRKLIL